MKIFIIQVLNNKDSYNNNMKDSIMGEGPAEERKLSSTMYKSDAHSDLFTS